MSSINRLSRILSIVIVLGAAMGSAHAATQDVAPVTLPKGGHGVDGPFFPTNRVAAVTPSTGTQLQQQAQQRIDARMGANSVLSNGASITKAQAQSSGWLLELLNPPPALGPGARVRVRLQSSAAAGVLVRFALRQYLASPLYTGGKTG